jgi:hypothetical protein
MSAGTDAARAIVRGVHPKRPGLDLRPARHRHDVAKDTPLCRCGREFGTWRELGEHVSTEARA